jgi:hypothetical protein
VQLDRADRLANGSLLDVRLMIIASIVFLLDDSRSMIPV